MGDASDIDPLAIDDDIVGRKFGVPWAKRRWVMFAVLAWAMGETSYVLHFVSDPAALAQKSFIVQALVALIASLVLGYVGFAVQDDRSRRAAVVSYAARVSPRAMTTQQPLAGSGKVDNPDG